MLKINGIQLAAGIGSDVEGELRDLEDLMKLGTEKAKQIRHQFNHIDSLLTGMSYVIRYIEDTEEMEELDNLIDTMRSGLMSNRRECMEIIYSAKVGRKVSIKSDAPGTLALEIAGTENESGHIVYGLKGLDAVKEEFVKIFG